MLRTIPATLLIWARPASVCPACESDGGRLFSIGYGKQLETKRYRCEVCGHIWEISLPDPEEAFWLEKPGQDKRN